MPEPSQEAVEAAEAAATELAISHSDQDWDAPRPGTIAVEALQAALPIIEADLRAKYEEEKAQITATWAMEFERLKEERDAEAAKAEDDIRVQIRADWKEDRDAHRERAKRAEAKVEKLREALRRLQMGPDTLTQDGLRIVLDALYPDQEGSNG